MNNFFTKLIVEGNVLKKKDLSCPKVTVITPSYNQAQYLEKTILSVLNQGYPNLEYIVIDGKSSDGSIEIIKKYQEYIDFWISEKDNGQSEAINKGLKRATGDYVGWINSDDLLCPQCLQTVIETFEKNPNAGIVYGDVYLIDGSDNILRKRSLPHVSFPTLLRGNPSVIQQGSFYRKKFLEQVGPLNENLHFVMDHDLWLRLAKVSDIKWVPEALGMYRMHDDSKTITLAYNFIEELFVLRKSQGITRFSWSNRVILYWLLRNRIKHVCRKWVHPRILTFLSANA